MGKAGKWVGKWVMNLLLGKKEGKRVKKTDQNGKSPSNQEDFSMDGPTSTPSLPPQTPSIHKRRWSFGKSSSKDRPQRHSFNPLYHTSTDAIAQLLKASSVGSNGAVGLAMNEATTRCSHPSPVEGPTGRDRLRIVSNEHAAAIRIQSLFRSYLARKALGALKGLVKLQALARGHLVRKQMSATIRKMHAVMSIQVRARFQRIQTTALTPPVEPAIPNSQSSAPASSHSKRVMFHKKKDNNLNDSKAREEQLVTRRHSGDLSFLKRDRQYEESCYSSPRLHHHYNKLAPPITPGRTPNHPILQPDSSLDPNYMSKTQSSRAKARSHSEPKQRPRKSVSSSGRRSPSSDGTNSVQDESRSIRFPSSVSHSERVSDQDQWFVKLYRPGTPRDVDYYPVGGNRDILVACEPHLSLY